MKKPRTDPTSTPAPLPATTRLSDPPWTMPVPGFQDHEVDRMIAAVVAELAPATPRERLVAQNLAEIEADLLMTRHRRNALMQEAARTALVDALCDLVDPADFDALLEGWDTGSSETLAELEELGVSPDAPHNAAWLQHGPVFSAMNAEMARLERRRRTVTEEYERLQALRRARAAGPVEEAEILG